MSHAVEMMILISFGLSIAGFVMSIVCLNRTKKH